MKVEITGDKYFFNTINFFKKKSNWQQIMAGAAEKVAKDIQKDAKKKLYQYSGGGKSTKIKKNTGALEKSIKVSVDVFEDIVEMGLGSGHPAAAIIEFGGYSPFPDFDSGSRIWDYAASADRVSPDPWHIAMGVYKNQPFSTPRPAMQNALREGLPKLNKEIWAEAKRLKP